MNAALVAVSGELLEQTGVDPSHGGGKGWGCTGLLARGYLDIMTDYVM